MNNECLRLINAYRPTEIYDTFTHYADFNKECKAVLTLQFNRVDGTYPSKEVNEWLEDFNPKSTTATIVDFFDKLLRYATMRLGGPRGDSGWRTLYNFLNNRMKMNQEAKDAIDEIRVRRYPGFLNPAGVITEQMAALFCYQMMLGMYSVFRKSSSTDISWLNLTLTPEEGNVMNFSNLGPMWRDMLAKYRNVSDLFPVTFLQHSLGEAIKRIDPREGLILHERFHTKRALLAFKPQFKDWESEDVTRREEIQEMNISLLHKTVDELVAADKPSGLPPPPPSHSRNRRPINISNTSMVDMQRETERLNISSSYYEDFDEEEYLIDYELLGCPPTLTDA